LPDPLSSTDDIYDALETFKDDTLEDEEMYKKVVDDITHMSTNDREAYFDAIEDRITGAKVRFMFLDVFLC
jgi:hypothetical protein